MNGREAERARRVSEYVDSLVVQRRRQEEDTFAVTPEDRELRQLGSLALLLSRVDLVPPDGFDQDLRRHVQRLAALPPEPGSAPRGIVGWWRALMGSERQPRLPFPPRPRLLHAVAVVVLLAAVGAGLLPELAAPTTASAEEILTRAGSALRGVIPAGKVLYRRWQVVERVKGRGGRPEHVEQRTVHEWLDGSDLRLVAGRSVTASGQLRLAYATVKVKGAHSPRVYFAPGFSGAPKGLLSIEPTREEFQAALAKFHGRERAMLETYLARGYIYEPILGELHFNRAALSEAEGHQQALPRIMLSLKSDTMRDGLHNGLAVYMIRMVDPLRVRFRWKEEGPPIVWLEHRETVRYISQSTYLNVKQENTVEDESGRIVVTTSELAETHLVDPLSDAESPFLLKTPPDTPVRKQSAHEQLSQVAQALRRAQAHSTTFNAPAAGARSAAGH